ncbi:MAG: response regulator [Candidatus Schekmanbacteria bacterium]|nr:response regulator [Candidatus Schekmanbacteria bacterium]
MQDDSDMGHAETQEMKTGDSPVRVLVIDDEARITRMLQVVLERQGYQVVVANNGLDGVRMAKREAPNLILLDLMMPQLDGYDVADVLRSGQATARIPIIVLSAKSAAQDAGKSYRRGVNYFMQKPFRLKRFLEVVEELLANPSACLKDAE